MLGFPKQARTSIAIAAAVVTAAVGASAAHAGRSIVVKPSTNVRLEGTDAYCVVYKQGSLVGVACAHLPKGPSSSASKGYIAIASEKGVVIETPGAKKAAAYAEPPFGTIGSLAGGEPRKATVTLGPNQVAAVGGTHMAVYATPAVGGDEAIGVVFVDPKERTLVGTYNVAISNKYVTVIKVTGPKATKVVYRHVVY